MSQTTDTLPELADEVETQQDLARFVARLREDLARNPDGWENSDLSSYLEAMSGWIEDMDGYYSNMGIEMCSVPPFRMMARILLASTIYE